VETGGESKHVRRERKHEGFFAFVRRYEGTYSRTFVVLHVCRRPPDELAADATRHPAIDAVNHTKVHLPPLIKSSATLPPYCLCRWPTNYIVSMKPRNRARCDIVTKVFYIPILVALSYPGAVAVFLPDIEYGNYGLCSTPPTLLHPPRSRRLPAWIGIAPAHLVRKTFRGPDRAPETCPWAPRYGTCPT
jgi:hypothetical protein